ncbi:MAG TPA: hypothetical protein VFH11_13570 [Gemmatimonadota bacterium]|nr:hypothetical protein [Gemmatimonadota bacterium]
MADRKIDVAGKPPASTGDPTVTATVPNTAPQDTTLDVQVSGSGFDRGSRVDLALDGVVSSSMKTNSTRFVNKTRLVANITIAADAEVALYDVIVTTTKGKRGIGIELFAVTYQTVVIGTLPGDQGSAARSISPSGEVVALSSSFGSSRIFLWKNGITEVVGPGVSWAISGNRRIVGHRPQSVWEQVGGAWQETVLPTLPGINQESTGISTDGNTILGRSAGMPVFWTESAGEWTVTALPQAPGGPHGRAFARDINADGMIVGSDGVSAGVWVEDNGFWIFHALASFPSGTWAVGWAINDNGDVAGWSEDDAQGGFQRALIWRKTPTGWAPPEPLGTLGGVAHGINNAGQVVGYSRVSEQPIVTHAFLWTAGEMLDIGRQNVDSAAYDINDSGQIVGVSNGSAVLWAPQ